MHFLSHSIIRRTQIYVIKARRVRNLTTALSPSILNLSGINTFTLHTLFPVFLTGFRSRSR